MISRTRSEDVNFTWNQKTGDFSGVQFLYPSYGSSVSEVEVDCLTGDHVVKRCDIVMDVGRSINPAVDVGQVSSERW